jgi:hypothetical protein
VGGDGKHGNVRTLTIEQTIDEMQIARSAAPCAHGEFARQMRLGAGSERSDLLMPDMNPLDFAVPTNSIRQTVEAIADDAVDAFHARGDEGLDELIGHNICHGYSPSCD